MTDPDIEMEKYTASKMDKGYSTPDLDKKLVSEPLNNVAIPTSQDEDN